MEIALPLSTINGDNCEDCALGVGAKFFGSSILLPNDFLQTIWDLLLYYFKQESGMYAFI